MHAALTDNTAHKTDSNLTRSSRRRKRGRCIPNERRLQVRWNAYSPSFKTLRPHRWPPPPSGLHPSLRKSRTQCRRRDSPCSEAHCSRPAGCGWRAFHADADVTAPADFPRRTLPPPPRSTRSAVTDAATKVSLLPLFPTAEERYSRPRLRRHKDVEYAARRHIMSEKRREPRRRYEDNRCGVIPLACRKKGIDKKNGPTRFR